MCLFIFSWKQLRRSDLETFSQPGKIGTSSITANGTSTSSYSSSTSTISTISSSSVSVDSITVSSTSSSSSTISITSGAGGGGGGGGGKTTNTIELPWGTFNNPSTFGNSKAKYTTQLANVNRIADKKRVVDGENTYEWDTADQKYKQTRLGENELEEDTRYTQAELMGIVSPYYGNVPSDFNFGGRTESSVPAAAPVLENLTININDKLIPIKEIDAGAYTFIDGKPYTKKQFFKAIQSKRLSQKQVEEGGKIAQQLQNKRG